MSDEQIEQYAIWWTSELDCGTIGDIPFDTWPTYLQDEYRSRLGRNGRGRLWVAMHAGFPDSLAVDPWPKNHLAFALGRSYGGIVIRAQDAAKVAYLPGLVTDIQLNLWKESAE